MCNSLCMCACLYEAMAAPASPVIDPNSCIKHKQISVPDIYLCVCGCLLWRAGPACTCVSREMRVVCVCLFGGATISCVQVAVFEGLAGRTRGAAGHVGLVCGNPALLTSHTLFSRSYKPLMPQKMLSLLWPAEGGGAEAGRRQPKKEGSEPSMAASLPLFPLPLPSSAPLSSPRFAPLGHFGPLQRIWPSRISGFGGGAMLNVQKN